MARILEDIDPIITADQNGKLLAKFTTEKVYNALKDMGPTKAPGIDGFLAMFF